MDFQNKNDMLELADLGEKANVIASVLADSYIEKKNLPKVEELLEELNQPYQKGKLYVAHVVALQSMLKEEFEVIGINLEEFVNKNGEVFTPGKLSNYESKVLLNKLDNVTWYTNLIRKIKEGTN